MPNVTEAVASLSLAQDSRKLLGELVHVVSEENRAMSFYFGSAGTRQDNHRDEHVRLHELIASSRAASEGGTDASVERELSLAQAMEPDILERPRLFRALFVSEPQGISYEITLPLAINIEHLTFGRTFTLVPLLRALEACAPYAVVIIESGKARGFTVRGERIEERKDLFPPSHIAVHAENERVGWPHHVDSNAAERRHRFFRNAAKQTQDYVLQTGAQCLVVGCRNAVWSDFQPELARVRVNHTARFPLKSFEVSPALVQQESRAAWLEMKQRECDEFWERLAEDPSRSVTDIESALYLIQEGRVRRLFLGAIPDTLTRECAECGRWQTDGDSSCPYCKATMFHLWRTDEFLLRKALASGADILAPLESQTSATQSLGALLRY